MSTPSFYPIKNLEDILAKFRNELNEALAPIYERLDRLEEAVYEGKGITPEAVPTGEGREVEVEGGLDPTTLRNIVIQLRYVNIALRGYGQLMTELGLPKDMRKAYIQLEHMVMMVLRLIQFIRIMDMLSRASALAALGPFGYVIAGGFIASTIAYGAKTTGGF